MTTLPSTPSQTYSPNHTSSSYTSATCTSPTSYQPFTPPSQYPSSQAGSSITGQSRFSPRTLGEKDEMNWDGPRIVMGGRVSRPSSPEGEKSMSIEVPAIILTEPPPYSSPFPSPGGKST
ncbi:hypothetical protein M231_08082, partial [Tremella mesenterica]